MKWQEKGKQKWRPLGTDDRRLAETVCNELNAILAGRLRYERIREILEEAAKVEIPCIRVPLPGLWERYEAAPKTKRTRPRTEASKKQHVQRFLDWMEDNRPDVLYLNEVTHRAARDFFSDMRREVGPQTWNNRRASLRVVFRVVGQEAGLENNVWDTTPRLETQNEHKRPFTIEEAKRLYKAAVELVPESRWPGFWPAAVGLGWYGGLRMNDVAPLEWSELDMETGVVDLIQQKTWRNPRRVVFPIPDDVRPWIEQAPRTDHYVWPEAAAMYLGQRPELYEEFREILGKAEVKVRKGVGFHGLRASHVTVLRDNGVPMDTIRESVGHSTQQMTQLYNHSLAAGRRCAESMPGLRGE